MVSGFVRQEGDALAQVDENGTHNLSRRLDTAESVVSNLSREVAGMRVELTDVRQGVRDIYSLISDQGKKIADKDKTNWGLVIVAIGVFLSILIYYNKLILDPVAERLMIHRHELDLINDYNRVREREIGRDEQKLQDVRDHVMDILKEKKG